MYIKNLAIKNVRIINTAEINPGPNINLLIGKNASGKTSILEAISILATTRTFRTDKMNQVISHNKDNLLVRADIASEDKISKIGVQRQTNKNYKIIVDFNQVKNKELADKISVQAINPRLSDLIFSGSKIRRDFLDWGVFHVKHKTRDCYTKFNKALRQRNFFLRSGNKDQAQINLWNEILAENGEELKVVRLKQLTAMTDIFNRDYTKLLNLDNINFKYFKGWAGDKNLLEALNNCADKDIEKGLTSVGPHLADIKILIDGFFAKEKLSRGEAKLLSFLLRMSQIKYFIKTKGSRPILLLDDISAELDKKNREIIMDCLIKLNLQVFITETSKEQIRLGSSQQYKMFHVKQGRVTESMM